MGIDHNQDIIFNDDLCYFGAIHFTKAEPFLKLGWQLNLLAIVGDESRIGTLEDLAYIDEYVCWLTKGFYYININE